MIRKYEWINGLIALIGWFIVLTHDAKAGDTFGGVCDAIVIFCMLSFTLRLYRNEKNQVA